MGKSVDSKLTFQDTVDQRLRSGETLVLKYGIQVMLNHSAKLKTKYSCKMTKVTIGNIRNNFKVEIKNSLKWHAKIDTPQSYKVKAFLICQNY